jgi:serine/threonine protein kinase
MQIVERFYELFGEQKPMVYCESCGAANNDEAIECFACHRLLLKDASVVAAETQQSATDEEEASSLAGQRYRIVARVGTGGFGAVYKAIDVENNQQPVAIKEIKLTGLKPQEMIEATDTFNREVQILSPLSHPNLPRVHAHFTDTNHWYLVMDYIEGQTLESYLAANGGKLPPEEVLAIGLQLCTVLDYLHTREPAIIFRDLKPSNVMLTLYRQVYLIDFGTARLFKPGRPRDTIAFGSPGYAAPEQYGKAQTTPRADIYSLGALLHHMLTGRDPAESPFQFALLRACDKQLPADLEKLIARMVEQEVSKRPESATEVKKELERCSTERTRGVYAQPGTLSSPIYQPGSDFGQAPPASWATSKPSLAQVQQQLGLPVTSSSVNPSSTKNKISRRALVGGGVALTIAGSIGLLQMTTAMGRPQPHREGQPDPNDHTIRVYKGHAASVRSVAWSRTLANSVQRGPYIASASSDKTVQVWEAQTGILFNAFRLPAAVVAMAWSADGRYIISSDGRDNYVRDVQTSNVVFKHQLGPGEPHVTAVAWSQNSRYFAMAGKAVQVFDITTKKLISICQASDNSIYSIAWAPHSDTLIAMGGADGEVYQWNSLTGEVSSAYSIRAPYSNQVYAIAWSPDGRFIASAHDSIVHIWDSKGMTDITVYTHHAKTVTALAWSHNPFQIASASLDGTVHIWNPRTGQPCFIYNDHHKPVRTVAWEPGGTLIASAGDDKKVRVWQAPPAHMPPQ